MNAPNFEDLFPLVDAMKALNDMQNLKRHDRLSDFIPKLSEFVSCNCVTSSMLDMGNFILIFSFVIWQNIGLSPSPCSLSHTFIFSHLVGQCHIVSKSIWKDIQ